ncbi:MAG: nucleotidyltransferase domain-containing protein [Oscillospiraceae bacterium]|nr:nucleotidyltransferase domain-containing protein [Oscillospiraceae bacterium]
MEEIRRIIEEKCREIEREQSVLLLGAVESGSRAWGIDSPDSDYDVRFLYLRRKEDYLRLEGFRDVIEWQLDDVLDINGWDLYKALRLLKKSNPTVIEWTNSPVVYFTTPLFEAFKELVPLYFSPKKGAYHYLSMTESNWKTNLSTSRVKAKKYFYVLRPLLAALWIIHRQTPPPVLFERLVDAELPEELKGHVAELLQRKKEMNELELIDHVEEIDRFVLSSVDLIRSSLPQLPDEEVSWEAANAFFLRALEEMK